MTDSILHVSYAIEDRTVVCSRPGSVERIRPWGKDAGAWRCSQGEDWKPFSPALRVDELEQTLLRFHGSRRILPCRRHQLASYRFLLDSWPEYVKDRVRPFSCSHWPVLQFVNHGGERASQLLESNPALALLASVDPAETAFHLTSMRRRALAARYGFPDCESAVRLLGKVEAECVSFGLLSDLRTLFARGADAVKALLHVPRINPLLVRIAARDDLRRLCSFGCLSQIGSLGADIAHFDVVERMEAFRATCRAGRIQTLADIDLRPAAPAPQSGRDWIPQENGIFPRPPLPAPPGIEPITTRRQLVEEGRFMHHCAGTDFRYYRGAMRGRLCFYRMLEPERATICLRSRGPDWEIDQVRGPANRLVSGSTLDMISRWIASDGLRWQRPLLPAPASRRRPARDAGQLSFDFA